MTAFFHARPAKILCLVLCLLIATLNLPIVSFACWSSPPPGCREVCPDCPDGDNRVIETTGNVYYWLRVLSIPGKGLPLTIDLVYNSNSSDQLGAFGYGWSLNYNTRVVDRFPAGEWVRGGEGGKETSGTPYLELRRENGDVKIFDLYSIEPGLRTYRPRAGEYETIFWISDAEPYYVRELKNGIQYRFNAAGWLTSITDPNGNRIVISRNAANKITSVADASGLRTVTFTGTSLVSKITGPDGSEYTFAYDDGDLVEYRAAGVSNPLLMTYDSTNYDEKHRMISRTDAYGDTVTYTYDQNLDGMLVARRDQNLNTVYYAYEGNQTIVRDPKGYRRIYTRDHEGHTTRIQWQESEVFGGSIRWVTVRQEEYDFGASGMMIYSADGRGNVTRYEYDDRDNRTAIVNPALVRTELVYDEYNNVIEITQAVGSPLERTFDLDYGLDPERRNLASISWEVGGNAYSRDYDYNSDGSLAGYTDARGKSYDFTYTEYGNLETIVDPLLNLTELSYFDAHGRLRTITNALDFTTTYSYIDGCACNPLSRIDYPDGSFAEFSRDNRRIMAVTDRNGNVTRYPEYDGKSQLLEMIDAMGHTANFSYDENDNLSTIEDAGANVTAYEYDAADRLVRTVFADESYEELAYDGADNITSRRLRSGEVINYQYDNLNRLTLKTYPDATTVEYGYDLLDRLTDVENYYYSLHYTYDDISRVSWFNATDKDIGVGYTVGYEYDAEGNRAVLFYPSGYAVGMGYDDLNRVDQLIDTEDNLLADYSYDAMRRTGVTLFNAGTEATFTSYTYDDANSRPDHLVALANWSAGTDNPISSFGYTYDHEGNRLSMAVEPAWGTQSGTIGYDYDLIYQLTGAEGPGFETYPDASFTYDSRGNRTQVVFSGQTEVYAANQLNQYTSVSSVNYQYDLNGNLTDDGNQLYEYDWENRLAAVRRKSDDALIAEYRYDPFGRRAKKFVYIPEARVVNYLYDGAQVIEERNEDFEPAKRFVYGPGIDEPISIQNVISGETYFYQRDGLGSVTELTDAEGNVVERYRYSPFGKLKIYDGSWNQLTGSTVGNPYFFTGRRYDPESGLYYYRARMYSQEMGRFLQPDPIGYADDYNLYRYVSNNPIVFTDPSGNSLTGIIEFLTEAPMGPLYAAYAAAIAAYYAPQVLQKKMAAKCAHCMASCELAKATSVNAADRYGIIKELLDEFSYKHCGKNEGQNPKDIAINRYGSSCPKSVECDDWCSKYCQ